MENLFFNYCKARANKFTGMKKNGSFTKTKDKKLWMVFQNHDTKKFLDAGGKNLSDSLSTCENWSEVMREATILENWAENYKN